MMRCSALLVAGLLLVVVPGDAAPTPEQVKDVAADLVCLCGTCNRESLSTCLCGFATSERDAIGEMLEGGQTRQQIVDSYVGRFGPMGLANPPEGYDLVWVVPFVMLGAGVLGVRQVLVYWRGERPATTTPGGEGTVKTSSFDDRLRRDLEEFEA
ncbi:MAG: hypothetical protein CME04_13595 [Gemmatimonadaceae bacterium]|nr:hypothetical protein [Gemmatimonadaceae bacterium]